MINSGCRIEFHDVSLSYEDKTVLDGVSFCVSAGELKGILGGSGSGKSSLLKLTLGLIKPDAGHVVIDGKTLPHMRRRS